MLSPTWDMYITISLPGLQGSLEKREQVDFKGQREWLSAVKQHLLYSLVMNGIGILFVNKHALTAFKDLHKINRPKFQHE